MTNTEIAQLFRNVAAAYTIQNEQKYRFQILAYEKAADTLEHTPVEVRELWKEGKLSTLPGVGPGISAHLEELFTEGRVKHFEAILKQVPQTVYPLLDIPSFGPKRAFKLVSAFHLQNPTTIIEDLENLAKKHEIAKLEGFGDKSEEDILRAIKEFRQGMGKTTRMALPYAAEMAEKILAYLRSSKHVLKAEALGSLRRMKSTIGDVDIAVAATNPLSVIKHFTTYPNIERVIEKGDVSASILVSGGKQIDLIVLPKQQFGSLLQHFTGSKDHNVRLREYALKKGMSLSERGIKVKKNGKEILKEFDTEEKFYKALGLDWIPPEIREDTGEIELAAQHKLPQLIELNDIKGDLHIHSNYPIEPSHDLGESSMEMMLEKARQLKYEYLGFSEHNPSVSKHTKDQIYSILSKRKEKIEQIKKSIKDVRIINLLEVDILPNGNLAIDDKAIGYLDGMIVSIHSVFTMGKAEMTKRVLQALSHPKTKILAHPTGRMLNQRPGYELDFDKVFDFCKKNNKAVEINSWYKRLDLPDVLVRSAIEQGVKLVIDTDSHEVGEMDLMKYGVSVARRGWATKNDVLNSWDWTRFAKWFNIN